LCAGVSHKGGVLFGDQPRAEGPPVAANLGYPVLKLAPSFETYAGMKRFVVSDRRKSSGERDADVAVFGEDRLPGGTPTCGASTSVLSPYCRFRSSSLSLEAKTRPVSRLGL
jgi:hypothetical protein